MTYGSASFGSISYGGLSGSISETLVEANITLPGVTLYTDVKQGSIEVTTIRLPVFSININAGLIAGNLLPQIILSASGFPGNAGRYVQELPEFIVEGYGTIESGGSFNISLPVFTLDAELKTGEISLPSVRNIPLLRLLASGFVDGNGDITLSMPMFTMIGGSYNSENGNFSKNLNMLILDAYADSYVNRII